MWISEEGSTKVEVISIKCQDPILGEITVEQYLAHQWAAEKGTWLKLIQTGNINLLEKVVQFSDLIEFPSPDWQADAMRSEGE